ncbi:TetR/AcrR family transcriptional regulator [Neorhizobium sp. P12A]|uniref:TetR/AcrR family transcriptional regulator n=1 Tax=Neorhizobium sp. P12A TaxID=2268027 RepID=UPI0011EF2DAF|nr:TetR/AcrR family transcriptional regulator [Neorhizobium sp. P12A]KAA0689531.1 TetR/AcrR family transcriptional regulator [Neorhizobium sp. P12A]
MGHSQVEKQRTHERIVEIAAKRLREEGLEGVGVADLMKEAGLTVGGFYKHFASRDELVAEAMDAAFRGWEKRLAEKGITPVEVGAADYIASYLSTRHRDDPGEGCAFGALNGELARSDAKTREIATERMKINIDVMADRLGGKDSVAARSKAILTLSAMAGAVGFARIATDPALSEEILKSVTAVLQDMVPTKSDA